MTNDPFWADHLRRTLQCYDEFLLRRVAAKLCRPRSQWPVAELIQRCVANLADTAVIDRRLQDLDAAGRKLLACMAHSGQPRWKLGYLVELLGALGHPDGLQPIFALLEAGLLYPELVVSDKSKTTHHSLLTTHQPLLESFEQWLGRGSAAGLTLFALPQVMHRALGSDLGLRDLDRLRSDPLLNGPPADHLADLPDTSLLTIALAEAIGVAWNEEGELRVGDLPAEWEACLSERLAALWTALPFVQTWNPLGGWSPSSTVSNPYPSAYLLSLLLLANQLEQAWTRAADVEQWVLEHHPFWREERPSERQVWLAPFLLGLAYQLRMVQAVKGPAGEWLVRLSPIGRWLLGLSEAPSLTAPFTQTLLVQPNLEIVVYRQGLAPGMIARLSRFAAWKSLGAACTLQLQAETVYRALESGMTFEGILQMLEQHGMRPVPPAVIESLRTWADKRERITVYPSATLFEFSSSDDLNEALARGLVGVRLSDRLLVVADEKSVDFRHYRLSGTRDYGLRPEKCVAVDADGITLAVDLARSDLLLEMELQRFAESLDASGVNGQRRYRLTPASLTAGRESGLDVGDLDDWFRQRVGQPLSPAARLLFTAEQLPPLELRPQLVLHVANAELADGLAQWPGTRSLIRERLGPTTLVVAEEDVDLLKERLSALGVNVQRTVRGIG